MGQGCTSDFHHCSNGRLTIQVPLAAVVDSLTGNAPNLMDYIGAAAVMVGFAGINIPSDAFSRSKEVSLEQENGNVSATD